MHADIDSPPHSASGWTDTELVVRLRRGAGGSVRVDGVLSSAPVWFRWDGTTLWLVGSGASPVGEDRIRVCVDVGPGVRATIRSVAATVVYAARGEGTRWDTEVHVAEGASLHWQPEPVILTERARHEAVTTVYAAAGADVLVDEMLVLGRVDEPPGALRSTLDVRVDGAPALLTSIDTSIPGWSGPAGVDGAAVVGNRLRVGRCSPPSGVPTPPASALLHPAPACHLAVTAASSTAEARRALEVLLPSATPIQT